MHYGDICSYNISESYGMSHGGSSDCGVSNFF